jgi:hypothetical protein
MQPYRGCGRIAPLLEDDCSQLPRRHSPLAADGTHLAETASGHDLIGSSALAGGPGKDFIVTARVTVIVTTMHAMMMEVCVAITAHVVAVMAMVAALHVVVTTVVPGCASAASMCLGHRSKASDQDCCPQAYQKFRVFCHCPPPRVAKRSGIRVINLTPGSTPI